MEEVPQHKPAGMDEKQGDRLVTIAKGAVSLVPMAGGPLAEIVGAVIPGRRADRIAAYLRALSARVDAFERPAQAAIASDANKVELIEELPEFDASKGDFKHSTEISHPGRMLLAEIGLETPFDAQDRR